jgi:hypothetical protein
MLGVKNTVDFHYSGTLTMLNIAFGFFSISRIVKVGLFACSLVCAMNGNAVTMCYGACPPSIVTTPIVSLNLNAPNVSVNTGSLIGLLQLIPTQSVAGWQYLFSTANPVTSVTLPYFSDSLISTTPAPIDWSFSTSATDVFGLGNGAGYMKWSYIGAAAQTLSPIFSFQSFYAPANATYQFVLPGSTTVISASGLVPLSPSGDYGRFATICIANSRT